MKNTQAKEKVSYLRGLIDGQNIKDEAQRKLYAAIVDALSSIAQELSAHAEAIDDIDDSIVDLYDIVDELDEDMFDDDDLDFLEARCPHCGETVFFDHEMLEEDELICPACNAEIDILDDIGDDIEDEDDEDGDDDLL